jgi:hypothetical protein
MEQVEEIKQRLEGLNRRQLCQFAWLWGLRGLPFLSVISDFAYWPMKDRQKYLYSVFNALDASALTAFTNEHVIYAANAADAGKVAKAASNAVYTANAGKIAKAASNAIDAAVNAAYAAANATYSSCNSIAHNAAYAALDTDSAANATDPAIKLISFTWEDIKAIKKNKLVECNHDINIYGEIWDRFQENLKSSGCAYWARFYESLFNSGFTIDKPQLERHFFVPDEIRAEGASAVGYYLEGLGENVERLNEARIIILGEKGAGKTWTLPQ